MNQIYPAVSYITSEGDEVFLSLQGDQHLWEIIGRSGFGAPGIKTTSRQYANGFIQTLAAIFKSRECSLHMVVCGNSSRERDAYFFDMISRLVQTGTKSDWGKLKIRRTDGIDVYLNCLYSGGIESVKQEYRNHQKFTLTFTAGDPYFYDFQETVLQSEKLVTPIRLHTGLFLGKWKLNSGITDISIDNSGEMLYPVVEVTGPASNIRITNNTTGKTLAISSSYSLQAGRTMIIDCRENQRGITLRNNSTGGKADISNQLALGSSLIWPIVKGTNRLSLYYTASSSESGYEIRFQKRYLSA